LDNSRSRLGGSVDGDSSLTCRTAAILSAVAAESNMIRLACPKCHRSGQYRVDRLLEKYGPDIATPDLRHELAPCPHRHDMSTACQVEYVDRLADP
jgi:hypothetical protein